MIHKKRLKVSLPVKIADELRHDIILGILKKGECLNEIMLAEKYEVSRGPIRHAIVMLANEGIVENLSNGRTRVIGITTSDMHDYYKLRLYIESEAVKKILSQPEDDDYKELIDQLKSLFQAGEACSVSGSFDKFNELDVEFHYTFVGHAKSQISKQIWKTLSNYHRSIMDLSKTYISNQNMSLTIHSHKKIIDEFINRNQEAILEELAWHINNSVQLYNEVLLNIEESQNSNT